MANRDKSEKIKCNVKGLDAPEYYIIRIVENTLKDDGQKEKAEEFFKEANSALNAQEILKIAEKYVNVI